MELWVAEPTGQIVSSGRLKPVTGTDFAGIWGGSTVEAWRRQGMYRALTAARARSTLRRDRSLIQSDSTAYSRPILKPTASLLWDVLDPVRTAVEKLMLLHAAAAGEAERRFAVARHYYDVWCLLDDERIARELSDPRAVATMARDVDTFTRAAGLPSRGRPAEGFAASEAFDSSDPVNEPTKAAYDSVVLGSLLWEGAIRPSFEECCDAVRRFPSGLWPSITARCRCGMGSRIGSIADGWEGMTGELLRIEYGLERLLWQDPDQNQLDVWDSSPGRMQGDEAVQTMNSAGRVRLISQASGRRLT